MSDVEYVEALLKHAKLENYQIGLTKVFLRAGQMALLQSMRLDAMNEAARKIQRATRHFLFNRHRRRAALLIQTHWRGHCARAAYQQLRRDVAATTIQAAERGRQQRLRFLQLRHAALVVQAAVRMHLCRTAYVNTRRRLAATRIQSTWRGYIHRRPWRALKHMLAGRVARLRLHNLKLVSDNVPLFSPSILTNPPLLFLLPAFLLLLRCLRLSPSIPANPPPCLLFRPFLLLLLCLRLGGKPARGSGVSQHPYQSVPPPPTSPSPFSRRPRSSHSNHPQEASRQAELAPPRKKTDVAIETIRMMTLRVMRVRDDTACDADTSSFQAGLAFHSLSPTFLPLAAPIPCLSRITHIHPLPPFARTSISALLARLIKIPLPPSQEKAEKSRANSERQLAEVRAELERTKKELAGKAREVARLVGQLEQEQQRAEQAEERLEEMLREQDRERAEGRERVLHVASVASHKAAAGGGGGAAGALSSLPSFGGSGFSSSSSSPSAAAAAVAALAGGALGVVVDKHLSSQQSGGRAGAPGGNLGVPEGSRILARMASRRHPSPHTPANHPTWEETAAAAAAGGAADGAASAALTSSPSFSSSSSRSSPVPPVPPSSIASPPGSSGGGMAAAAAAAVAAMERAEGASAAAAAGEGTHDGAHRGHGGAADAHHLPCIQESASREEGEEKKVVAVSRTSSGGSGTGEFGGSSGGLRQVRFPSMGPEESEAEYTRASTLPVGRSMLRQQSMGKALKLAANADAAAGGSGGGTDGADARLARIRRLQSSNPRMGGGAGGEGGGGPGVPRPLVSAKSLTREEAVRMLASAQRDAEEAQKVRGMRGAYKLKEERRQLQVLYREAVAAAETALAAAAEERGRVGELQRTVEGKDEEIRELTEKNQELQLALTLKAREVRTLSQRLLASQAASDTEELPIDKQQELLLSEVASSRFPFGPEGQPVAACMVYRALLQWGALEAERTNTFDRIVEAFQRGSTDQLLPAQAYWLTNHIVLYYLVQVVYQPPVEQPAQESFSFSFFGMASRPAAPPKAAVERVDVMLFKQQLATGTERLFVTIRDAAKAELAKHFALPSQDAAAEAEGDQAAGDAAAGKGGKAGGGGGRRLARGRARGGGRSGAAMVRKHVVNYWANVVVTLKQVTATLAANHVPAVVVDALLRQLLFFVNVKIVNG
ncbi:unnamed protein product, partial [Closterium sp. Naga37s-1]